MPNEDIPEASSSFSNLDKVFHYAEFFILGLLIQLTLTEKNIFTEKGIYFFTIVLGFSMACIDEFHQSFVEGRHSSVADMLFDFAGILSSLFVFKNFD